MLKTNKQGLGTTLAQAQIRFAEANPKYFIPVVVSITNPEYIEGTVGSLISSRRRALL
jgi:hypothetical protein